MARRPRPARAASYEQRLILFIDFLGFKELVATTANDTAALTHLLAALDDIGRLGEADIFRSQRVTQFSDSVVMSYRVTEQSGVFWMINAIALKIISLAERGYLLRGAVTIGDLHHTRRHVVGPAMVRAYEMESQLARFPRVIVDPAVIRLARRHRQDGHSPADEEGYVRSFIVEDDDGQLIIDYVSWRAVVDVVGADDDGYPAYLGTLSGLVRKGLGHDDPRVVEKYLWLHPRYVTAINLFRSLPTDAPYRLENYEACEFIAGLPRFTALARAARSRVADAAGRRPRS